MRHIFTVLAIAAVVAAMTVMTVVPAKAQGGKAKAKGKAAAAPTAAPKAMPNTGGLISPSNVLVGLGGGALLVGGGLVALRAVRR